jgi:hypothetical protein
MRRYGQRRAREEDAVGDHRTAIDLKLGEPRQEVRVAGLPWRENRHTGRHGYGLDR